MGNFCKYEILDSQISPLCNLCRLDVIDTCIHLLSCCTNRHNKAVHTIAITLLIRPYTLLLSMSTSKQSTPTKHPPLLASIIHMLLPWVHLPSLLMLGHPLRARQITHDINPFSPYICPHHTICWNSIMHDMFSLAEIAYKHIEYDTLIPHLQQLGWNTKPPFIVTAKICGIIHNSSINKLKDMNICKFKHPIPHGNTIT